MSTTGTGARVGRDDIGSRVVVRHLLDDGRATDVVGELTAVDAGALTVQPDDAPPVPVAVERVVAAKVVPPRRVLPASSPDALERVMVQGWPGLETRRLGGWLLRAAGGFTRRANSALAAGDPGTDLDTALDAVRAFYRERALPASVQVTAPLPGDDRWGDLPVLGRLVERGWLPDEPTLVMTRDLRATPPEPAPLPPGLEAAWSPEPDEAWLQLYRYHGQALPPVAREVLVAAPWQGFLSVRDVTSRGIADRTVAVGRVAVAAGWAGITAMQVGADRRRQGLARHVLLALLRAGREQGARYAYLQVVADNAPAVTLYASAGFTPHHRYHYLSPPS